MTIETVAAEVTPVSPDVFYKEVEVKQETGLQDPAKEAAPVNESVKPDEVPAVEKTEDLKPGEYKLVKPENYFLDQKQIDDVVAFAKEHKISNEQAQKVLERENNAIASYMQKLNEENDAGIKAWAKEVESDQEIGGSKFKESVAVSHEVIKRYGSEKLTAMLNETGYGNHPEVVRLFAKIGREMQSGKFITPGAAASSPKKMEDVFYGTTTKE